MTAIRHRIGDIFGGARAGLVATGAMSLLLLAGQRLGLTGTLPPRRITDKAVQRVDPQDRPGGEDRQAIAGLAHFAFGAGAGALFGLLTGELRRIWISAGVGVAYGTLVYLTSYMGWIPAMNLMPPATQDRPGRVATMLGGHWIYGGLLGILMALTRRRRTLTEQADRRYGR